MRLSSSGLADELTTVLIAGDKSDTFVGVGTDFGVQVYKGSALITGGGNDTINGEGISETTNGVGASVTVNSSIQTDTVNDSINGVVGRKGVSVGGEETQEEGSWIDTGKGNDSITGSSETGVGIHVGVNGEIKTGAGNDTVDALIGGFAGSFSGGGKISLGADNDTLIGGGFGSGITFDGDGFLGEGQVAGTEDKIVLDDGFYVYTLIGESATLDDGSRIMEIKKF